MRLKILNMKNKNNKVFIIAEAGVNHNGSLLVAKKLIKVASKIGADAIKFQTFITEEEITKKLPSLNIRNLTVNIQINLI